MKELLIPLFLLPALLFAILPTTLNTNQFINGSGPLTIKSGALLTNVTAGIDLTYFNPNQFGTNATSVWISGTTVITNAEIKYTNGNRAIQMQGVDDGIVFRGTNNVINLNLRAGSTGMFMRHPFANFAGQYWGTNYVSLVDPADGALIAAATNDLFNVYKDFRALADSRFTGDLDDATLTKWNISADGSASFGASHFNIATSGDLNGDDWTLSSAGGVLTLGAGNWSNDASGKTTQAGSILFSVDNTADIGTALVPARTNWAHVFAGSGSGLTGIPLTALPASLVTNNYTVALALNNAVTFNSTANAKTNVGNFSFDNAWYGTTLAARVTNAGQRATLMFGFGFVDAVGGTPQATVKIEQNGASGAFTNVFIFTVPGGITQTITNWVSVGAVNPSAVVVVSDTSYGTGASVTVVGSTLARE